MTEQPTGKAMTMREIRDRLGHTTPELPDVTVQAIRYEVSLLPEDDVNRHVFTIEVEYRGAARWAVTRHGSCLGVDGTWDFGVKQYDRDDEWLNAHRFDVDTALRLAREAAPHVVVNGQTAIEVYRRTHPEETTR
ncbi:hypothetical protein OG911_28110 [Streptomyces sp. NBC_00208]|uniref:hypothetical protein n=1 Tax=Streptomyces sp. NBC_00208 TaxID=2975681 RepID=UPI002E2958B9|nr:hypothetical protein [Streptomyces sp. NBC_00208]